MADYDEMYSTDCKEKMKIESINEANVGKPQILIVNNPEQQPTESRISSISQCMNPSIQILHHPQTTSSSIMSRNSIGEGI